MIVDQSVGAVQGAFNDLWFTVIQYLPPILGALILLILGWIFGIVLYRVVVEIVKVLRLDEALRAAGVHETAREAGFRLDIGRFLGTLVEWFIILWFLDAALEVLNLSRVTVFLEQVCLLYLPQVIVAALILVLGAIVADVLKNIVSGSARAAGSPSANFAGAIAKWAIWIFAILAALDQLGIASNFVETLFTGIVIAISIAFGLAFGLGGKEQAARILEHIRTEVSHVRKGQ
jgi:hypothetical protein